MEFVLKVWGIDQKKDKVLESCFSTTLNYFFVESWVKRKFSWTRILFKFPCLWLCVWNGRISIPVNVPNLVCGGKSRVSAEMQIWHLESFGRFGFGSCTGIVGNSFTTIEKNCCCAISKVQLLKNSNECFPILQTFLKTHVEMMTMFLDWTKTLFVYSFVTNVPTWQFGIFRSFLSQVALCGFPCMK